MVTETRLKHCSLLVLYWSNERYNLPNRKAWTPIGLWMPFWEVRIPLLEGAQMSRRFGLQGIV